METKNRPDMTARKDAAAAQRSRAAWILLRRLKHQQHIVPQRSVPRRHSFCQSQQHGSVPVVAAGVHLPRVLRGKGQAGLLGDGQCIHIRPERQSILLSLVKKGADRPLDRLCDRTPQPLQLRLDKSASLGKVILQLWNAVQRPSVFNHILQHHGMVLLFVFSLPLSYPARRKLYRKIRMRRKISPPLPAARKKACAAYAIML